MKPASASSGDTLGPMPTVESLVAELRAFVAERYAAWENADGKAILDGKRSLDDLAELVLRRELDPEPKSGRQEYLERLVEEDV